MTGRCLCGGVTFEATGEVGGLAACHSARCRKQSGHVRASGEVPQDRLAIRGEVRRYAASAPATARRGVCPTCGSFLFWTRHDEDTISVALGAVEGPTGRGLRRHIFTADKGGYDDIADGLPQT